MGYKRINVAIEENLLKDMDVLIKAGFYKDRPELITKALLQIEPLKSLAEKRQFKLILDITKELAPMTTPISKMKL